MSDDPRFIINNCWKAKCIGDVAPIPPLPDPPIDIDDRQLEPPPEDPSLNRLDSDDILLGADFAEAIDEWTESIEAASPDSGALCALLREIGDEELAELACDMLTMAASFETLTAEPLPSDPFGGRSAELTPNLVFFEPSRQAVRIGDSRDPVLNYAQPIFASDQF